MQVRTPCEIELNGQRVEYHLVRSKSAQKLRVKAGMQGIVVVLPAAREVVEAETFLRNNEVWIRGQLARIEQLRGARRPEISHENMLLYRGEPTAVCMVETPYQRGPARITHMDGRILIARASGSLVPTERSLENWLRKQARSAIETELALLLPRLNVTLNRIYLMEQRTKWGNCSAQGNLSFNWRLILAPPFVLRYLVTHEVVHLAIPDHSRKFWLMLQSLYPETERARQWLCANEHEMCKPLLQNSSVQATGDEI